MNRSAGIVVLGAVLLSLTGCTGVLRDPVTATGLDGTLDLRGWSFERRGPVLPQSWLWYADALLTPLDLRAGGSAPAVVLAGPERGGTLVATLERRSTAAGPAVATARLRLLVDPDHSYGLQIGAVPGAQQVWVNGVIVWTSGRVSTEAAEFREEGAGALVTVQPAQGVLDIVVLLAVTTPLVQHPEASRLWMLGPPRTMIAGDRSEVRWRTVQGFLLLAAAAAFVVVARRRPEETALVPLAAFLALCFLKIAFNVEQTEPFIKVLVPSMPWSWVLLVNHGLNLVPFPVLALVLARWYPEELHRRVVPLLALLTVVVELWELTPFVALTLGLVDLYRAVMDLPWSLVLNLYVLGTTLFLFERIYQSFRRRRRLALGLFAGASAFGLLVLVPVPLSYVVPVKFTYFLGAGTVVFLALISWAYAADRARAQRRELSSLRSHVNRADALARYVDPAWASLLGRATPEAVRPGDSRPASMTVLQARFPQDDPDLVTRAAPLAAQYRGVLVGWLGGRASWVFDPWNQSALEFVLALRPWLAPPAATLQRVILTQAEVEFQALETGSVLRHTMRGFPALRLDELEEQAQAAGVPVVVDSNLSESLAAGLWRRHRPFTADGRYIEFYEGESEVIAGLKDAALEEFQRALALLRAGDKAAALDLLSDIVRTNPFDLPARHLLGVLARQAGPDNPSSASERRK